jgi:hypothetical protein
VHGGLVAEDGQEHASDAYEIRIHGHLNDGWVDWFYGLTITHESDGTTTLRGSLPDQTVLHSTLERIRDMNLKLISVNSVECSSVDEPAADSEGGAPA